VTTPFGGPPELAELCQRHPTVKIVNPARDIYTAEIKTSPTAVRIIAAHGVAELTDRIDAALREARTGPAHAPGS
jgi:hypothetical protein